MGPIATSLFLAISLAGVVLAAGAGSGPIHAAVIAAASLVFAILAVLDQRRLTAAGAGRAAVAASSARHVAYVWILGAMSVILTYNFILQWREWLAFGLGMIVIAGLCLLLASLFDSDAKAGKTDEAMLGLTRTLTIIQTIGMIIAMVGLVIDGKFAIGLAASRSDWAANNTFFFGALAVAIIGAYGLMTENRLRRATQSTNITPGTA
jgi:hypothetical protein